MFNKIMKIMILGVVIAGAFALPALAGGVPHTSWGKVLGSGADTSCAWKLYVVSRTGETLTGNLISVSGSLVYQAQVGNLPTTFAAGDDSVVFVSKATGAGTTSHAGYYAVMNEDLSVTTNPQQYNDATLRAINTPTAAVAGSAVTVSWSALTEDSSETSHGSNISGYNVYRSTNGTSFTKITAAPVTGTSFTDNAANSEPDPAVGATYYYAIEPVFRGNIALGVYSGNSNSVVYPTGGDSTPTITSVTLKDTTTASGYVYDTVDIKGTNFTGSGSATAPTGCSVALMSQGGSYVTLPASDIFWWDSGKIQVLVPHVIGTTFTVAGTASFRVTTPNGSATGNFTIKPKVYDVRPNSGEVGASVTVIGTGFHGTAGSNSVSFNGTSAAATGLVRTSSNETLTVAVPTGATTGQLLVTVNSQSSNANYDWSPFGPVTFTVNGTRTPRVTGIAPTSGEQGTTINVVISGADTSWNGDLKSAVSFSNPGITVNSATAASSTEIRASIEIASTAATGSGTVTVAGATGSAAFTVTIPGVNPLITGISPYEGPAGTRVVITGRRFGSSQGSSYLEFANTASGASYRAAIAGWNDSEIIASVPNLAATGTYEVKATRIIIVSGTVTALESNKSAFQVTAPVPPSGIATIYPNPFNPNAGTVLIRADSAPTGINLGVYIFDMTARLVARQVLTGTNQTTWDGKDTNGAVVGDGAYILRMINEDTKTLIARGKILVVKQ